MKILSDVCCFFFFQAEDGIRDLVRSRGLGDVYKRQIGAILLSALMSVLSKKIKFIQRTIIKETTALAGATTESLRNIELIRSLGPVSYTHLTLPTSDLV